MNSSSYLLIHVSMISLYQVEKKPQNFQRKFVRNRIKNERTNTQVIFSFLDTRKERLNRIFIGL